MDDGAVLKAPIAGGAPTTLASGQQKPDGIAVDAKSVYWTAFNTTTNEMEILTVPIEGGSVTSLASGSIGQGHIAVDDTSVYYCSDNNVVKTPVGGGAPTVLAAGHGCGAMVVDASAVYWANSVVDPDDAGSFRESTTIMKVPIVGGAPTVLASMQGVASGQGVPARLVLDATSVYWTLTVSASMTTTTSVMKLTPK